MQCNGVSERHKKNDLRAIVFYSSFGEQVIEDYIRKGSSSSNFYRFEQTEIKRDSSSNPCIYAISW
jgi:hypothetical protein